jgi:hypothetical protein
MREIGALVLAALPFVIHYRDWAVSEVGRRVSYDYDYAGIVLGAIALVVVFFAFIRTREHFASDYPLREDLRGCPSNSATDICRYRGYEIVPRRAWASWSVSIYTTRADLPLMSRSTLRTLAARKQDAVTEAKRTIDRVLGNYGGDTGFAR